MTNIHALDDKLLLHIIQLSYRTVETPQWRKVNRKFNLLVKKFQAYYAMYNHLENLQFSGWMVSFLKSHQGAQGKIQHWLEQQQYHRQRVKEETYHHKFELLFGGQREFNKIPSIITSFINLMHERIPPSEITAPFMQGYDSVGRHFITIKVPTGPHADDPVITYVLIREKYWRLHHNSGDRKLLGKAACNLSCLVQPYGFNPVAYRFCKDLFAQLKKKKFSRSYLMS